MNTLSNKRKLIIDTFSEFPLTTEFVLCEQNVCKKILDGFIDDEIIISNPKCIAVQNMYYVLIYNERILHNSIINLVILDYHDNEHVYIEIDFESQEEFDEFIKFIPRIHALLC